MEPREGSSPSRVRGHRHPNDSLLRPQTWARKEAAASQDGRPLGSSAFEAESRPERADGAFRQAVEDTVRSEAQALRFGDAQPDIRPTDAMNQLGGPPASVVHSGTAQDSACGESARPNVGSPTRRPPQVRLHIESPPVWSITTISFAVTSIADSLVFHIRKCTY